MDNLHFGIAWVALIAGICFLAFNNQHEWAAVLAVILVLSRPPKGDE
jgi:hypothetical protein